MAGRTLRAQPAFGIQTPAVSLLLAEEKESRSPFAFLLADLLDLESTHLEHHSLHQDLYNLGL